jgi:hypothetical protein
LSIAGSACAGLAFPYREAAAQGSMANVMERRIARIIREFEQQGFHRTGTVVDRLSADWLSKEDDNSKGCKPWVLYWVGRS